MQAEDTRTITNPDEITSELAKLQLPLETIMKAVTAYAAAHASAKPSQPVGAGGTLGWIEGTGVLRDEVSLEIWEIVNVRNMPTIRRRDGAVAVTIASGDSMTGIVMGHRQPSTRNPKGNVLAAAIQENKQIPLLGVEALDPPKHRHKPKRGKRAKATLILLIYMGIDEVRFELSLPSEIVNKRIVRWRDRIIFPALPRRPVPAVSKTDAPDDSQTAHNDTAPIDVPVKQRK